MMNMRGVSFKVAVLTGSLGIATALAFVLHTSDTPEQIVTTGASQWHHVTLKDGTGMHVDARSRIEVEYTDDARIVYVQAGSAVFDVAKDSLRPFIVRTHLVDATAVGTRFGVSIDPGVTTTVAEGIVKVTIRGQRTAGAAIMLHAGDELRVPDGGVAMPTQSKVNAERKLEWATGWLVFEGQTIGEIVNQLNRRNAVQIEIDQPEIAGRRMPGFQRFRVDSPAALARYIAATCDLTLTEEQSGAVLRLHAAKDPGRVTSSRSD